MLPYLFLSCPRSSLANDDRGIADLLVELFKGLAALEGRLLVTGDGTPDLEKPRHARCVIAIPIVPGRALYAEMEAAFEAEVPVVLIWPEKYPLRADLAGHPLVVEIRKWRSRWDALTEFRELLHAMRDRSFQVPAEEPEDGLAYRVLH